MHAAHACEGQPQVKHSGYLGPDRAALGNADRSGSAPARPFANTHARIRSAPPVRARTGLGSPNESAVSTLWIPSIPGRIAPSHMATVPALGVYSGTNSAATSRIQSCKSRQTILKEPPISHQRMGDRMSSAHASSQNGDLLTKETGVTRLCTSNILHSPRANWKCTDKSWLKLSQTSHRFALAASV